MRDEAYLLAEVKRLEAIIATADKGTGRWLGLKKELGLLHRRLNVIRRPKEKETT